MTHREKIDAMYRHLPQLRLGSYTFAPPLYRFLWRCGVEIPPPHFTAFVPLALTQGIFFGVFFAIALWATKMFFQDFFNLAQFSYWEAGLWGGAAFGIVMATIVRFQANRRHLPRWSDYLGI